MLHHLEAMLSLYLEASTPKPQNNMHPFCMGWREPLAGVMAGGVLVGRGLCPTSWVGCHGRAGLAKLKTVGKMLGKLLGSYVPHCKSERC